MREIYQVLYQGLDPGKAALELMEATARHELAGRKWKLFSSSAGNPYLPSR